MMKIIFTILAPRARNHLYHFPTFPLFPLPPVISLISLREIAMEREVLAVDSGASHSYLNPFHLFLFKRRLIFVLFSLLRVAFVVPFFEIFA
jgi:hypothetical protein